MDLVTRLFGSRRVLVPVVVGLGALLLAGVFAFITLQDTDPGPELDTRSFVSKKGGFSLDVPRELTVRRKGRTATFSSADKSLVVTVGPGAAGALEPASRRFVDTLRSGYSDLTLLGHEKQTIDGRPALAAYGQATNASGVRIRFVAVVVRHRPRNYNITAFTAFDTDPKDVLPRVNAIVNSFRIR